MPAEETTQEGGCEGEDNAAEGAEEGPPGDDGSAVPDPDSDGMAEEGCAQGEGEGEDASAELTGISEGECMD